MHKTWRPPFVDAKFDAENERKINFRYWPILLKKVENTAKTKFSQKLAGGRFLLRMRSSCEGEGRRKLLFKSTWSTVSDGVKRIRGS